MHVAIEFSKVLYLWTLDLQLQEKLRCNSTQTFLPMNALPLYMTQRVFKIYKYIHGLIAIDTYI